MAAGPVTVSFISAGGDTLTGLFWSSDGSETGTLSPMPILGGPGQDALADFGSGPQSANTLRAALTDEDRALLGATDEAAASTDESTSGLNGLVKRLLARVTLMVNSLATMVTSLGTIATNSGSTDPAPVVGILSTIAVTPTVTAGAYSTGQVIGGVLTVAAILRENTRTGYLTSVRITTKVANTVQIDAFIFNANPTSSTTTDNGAFSLHDSDRAKLKGVVRVDSWVAAGTPSVGYKEARVPLTGAAADDIYVVLVIRGAHTPGSTSDLTVEFTADQN